MFFQIDRAIDMVEKKIDYLRKPWVRTFPKIPFPSKLDRFFIQKNEFQKFWPFWIHERGHIWRKNINFLSRLPNFSFDPFVYRSNLRTTKIYRIFSALKCIYLELSTGKNRKSGGILVITARVNFFVFIVSAFRSNMARLNLKILKNHYHGVKIQQKSLHKNAITKKLFRKWNTLGCFICIKSENIIFL